MPDRHKFPRASFTGNPHRGKSARALYRTLRWGDEPNETWDIDAPEHMATLGELARIDFVNGQRQKYPDDDSAPFLAVGLSSNLLWIVPRSENGGPLARLPRTGFEEVAPVKRTDYYAVKNGEDGYYYHNHERPYPVLFVHESTGCMILAPSDHHGTRSYAVLAEGIVG